MYELSRKITSSRPVWATNENGRKSRQGGGGEEGWRGKEGREGKEERNKEKRATYGQERWVNSVFLDPNTLI